MRDLTGAQRVGVSLLRLAVAGNVLAAPATTQTTQPASALEQRRSALLEEMGREREQMIRDDPRMTLAFERWNAATFDNYAARAALDWAMKRKEAGEQWRRLESLQSVRTLLSMVEEPTDVPFVEQALAGTSRVNKAAIADEVSKWVEVKRKDLDDPHTLWETVRTKLPAAKQAINQELVKLPSQFGWPAEHAKAMMQEREATFREGIYSAYIEQQSSPRMDEIKKELIEVNRQIDAATTRP